LDALSAMREAEAMGAGDLRRYCLTMPATCIESPGIMVSGLLVRCGMPPRKPAVAPSWASSVASHAVGDDDAIAAVKLDMNLRHPGSRYLPTRSQSEPCPVVLASGDTHVIERDERS
jgi:hypothetical protein